MSITTDRRIVEMVRRHGPLSRAEVARRLRLSKPTVSLAVDTLVRRNLLTEVGLTRPPTGRSARLLGFNARCAVVAGIDLGASNLRLALADLDGRALATRELPTPQGAELAGRLAGELGALLADHAPGLELAAVVVGTPGVVTCGRILYSPNLLALEAPDFLEHLRAALPCEPEVHNDVNLAAVGEAGQDGGGLTAFLSVGTGLGVGLAWGLEVWTGAAGRAGEIGYLPFRSPVGSRLEEALSGVGLARLHAHFGGSGSAEAALANDDPPACHSREVLLEALAQALVVLSLVCDPARIVVGGGVGLRLGPLLGAARARAAVLAPFVAPLAVSRHGDASVQRGALRIATAQAARQLI